MRYTVYWGCTIRVRYPSVEKSALIVADRLGIELHEPPGFTCCPLPEAFHNFAPGIWRMLAVRNLYIASQDSRPLFIICNGCWESLLKAWELVVEKGVEDKLYKIERPEALKVLHAVDVLYDLRDEIAKNIVRPLRGIRLALQPGCKLYRHPEEERARKLAELVELLGAEVVEYGLEKLCCGIPTKYADEKMAAEQRALPKIRRAAESGADAFVTFCPGCMLQLEVVASENKIDLPSVNYMELLALAMGNEPKEIGLNMHLAPTDNFIKKVEGIAGG